MNRIEEMIKEMCPDGVRRVKLGEVITHLRTGLNPRVHFKLNTDDAKGYYITVRELMGKSIVPDEKTDRINDSACMRINERSKLQINDVLFSGTGTIGRTAIVSTPPTNWNIKEGVYALTPNSDVILPIYLLYILHSENVIEQIGNKAGGSTVKSIPMAEMRNLQIPLPPLPIQQEIVKILDSFTALQQNLEDELKLRQKQYEHYREKLLTFEDSEVEWKKLGDICSISAGGDVPVGTIKGALHPEGDCIYPVYSNGKDETALYGFSNSYKISQRAITIAARGSIGFHVVRDPFFTPIIRLITVENANSDFSIDYINYALYNTEITGSKGGIPQLTVPMVKNITIPMPPLSTQLQITQTLDHFESLISNLKTEIELRKKQYEYYREKLLTF